MPYPNFHSVRMTSPDNDGKGHSYSGITYKTLTDGGKQIDAVIGIYKGGSEIQAYRFPKSKWTIDEVRAWVTSHDYKPISIEAASQTANSFIPIDGVQMARVGTANDGRELSLTYLQAAAFGANMMIADGFSPKVKIGDNHPGKIVGIINFVYSTDAGLFADIEVPESVASEFESNPLLNDRSIELGYNFITKETKTKIPVVMTGIVFGIGVPANHALQSIFGTLDYAIEYFDRFSNFAQSGRDGKGDNMTKEEMAALMKPMIDALTALTAKVEAALKPAEPKPAEPANAEMESKLKETEAALTAEKAKVEKFESERKTAFFDSLVKSGKITPEAKTKVTETFESMLKGGATFETASESILAIAGKGVEYHTTPATGEGASFVHSNMSGVIDETAHVEVK